MTRPRLAVHALAALLGLMLPIEARAQPKLTTLSSHYLWQIFEAGLYSSDNLIFRRFAVEGDLIRNTFVFNCYKSKSKSLLLEVVTPKAMLPALKTMVGDKDLDGVITMRSEPKAVALPALIDDIAGLMNVEDALIDIVIENLDKREITVHFGMDSLNPQLSYTLVANKQGSDRVRSVLEDPYNVKQSGPSLWMNGKDVIAKCRSYRT